MNSISTVRAAIAILLLAQISSVYAQTRTNYPDIPRIDVHAHVSGDLDTITNYLQLREFILEAYDADLAMWIDLGGGNAPAPDLNRSLEASQGRILTCISDFSPHRGLSFPPEELSAWLEKGYLGYKIWAGPYARRLAEDEEGYRYIDDPAHIPTFSEMERIGMVAASIHIADPNGPFHDRTRWMPDPIEFWKNITAWRRVLERHPDLIAVVAHANWLICQDAQIDYLRNMLATFPNMYIDLAATFQYFYMVDHDNLRDFMIEWADRILFATDIGALRDENSTRGTVDRYVRCFRILETDEMVEGGFFGLNETRGLALPREALEKIYYLNAARIYPRVKEQLIELGYIEP